MSRQQQYLCTRITACCSLRYVASHPEGWEHMAPRRLLYRSEEQQLMRSLPRMDLPHLVDKWNQVKPRPWVLWLNKTHEYTFGYSYIWLSYHTSVLTTKIVSQRAERPAVYQVCHIPGIYLQQYFGFSTLTSTIMIRVSFFNFLCACGCVRVHALQVPPVRLLPGYPSGFYPDGYYPSPGPVPT